MHLLESASKVFDCVPFIHEVAAGIAAEYHNEGIIDEKEKAFVLVTAGPGLTNLVTAISGSFLESRDLLVVGGQVKSSDLKKSDMRQRGIQEIDGVSLVQSITKKAMRLNSPLPKASVVDAVTCGLESRKGPVFLEMCLDVQAATFAIDSCLEAHPNSPSPKKATREIEINLKNISKLLEMSERPILLLGGELSRSSTKKLKDLVVNSMVPVMTTWNAADRVPYNQENFLGRPDTWGMRYSNLLLQQSDLVLAIGARLSLQQTGFNYQAFVPKGKIVHIYSDESEFEKGLPNLALKIAGKAELYLEEILHMTSQQKTSWFNWMEFCKQAKAELPLSEECNKKFDNYWNPYDFYLELANLMKCGESLIPSSSGGAETVAMQSFRQNEGVRVITSSSLASMGYGLAGAIGTSLLTKKRVCLVEGDGGFAQNLQELGTAERQNLNLKIFIFCNEGYASIRMTQRNYFGGNYLGCDRSTGLGLPDWGTLFDSFGIKWTTLEVGKKIDEQAGKMWSIDGLAAFLVPVHPEQTYFPKITSKVLDNGMMESNPLHEMTPFLDAEMKTRLVKYL
jgi:acetolactate synthase-1/2/3 large subunit